MNIPRQAPARMPAKFHLLATTRLPKGQESRAFTANTCYSFCEQGDCKNISQGTYIEALGDKDGEIDYTQVSDTN